MSSTEEGVLVGDGIGRVLQVGHDGAVATSHQFPEVEGDVYEGPAEVVQLAATKTTVLVATNVSLAVCAAATLRPVAEHPGFEAAVEVLDGAGVATVRSEDGADALLRLDPHHGDVLWRQALPGRPSLPVVTTRGWLVAACTRDTLHLLWVDPATGGLRARDGLSWNTGFQPRLLDAGTEGVVVSSGQRISRIAPSAC